MARPLRLEHPGAIWHVTSRGNERKPIFADSGDRRRFIALLGRMVVRHRWELHAFVLMGNHYHLVVETPEPTLSRGMHGLNGCYAQSFNRTRARVGHLFQGRFKAILIERETHLLEVTRYVVLNPVRAGLVARASDWPWSSYRATAGIEKAPDWLRVDWTLAQFGPVRAKARIRYRTFVAAALGSRARPWDEVSGQIYLGSERFRIRMRGLIERDSPRAEIPARQTRIGRPGLAWLAASLGERGIESDRRTREAARRRALIAFLAREDAGASLKDIGRALSVRQSMASRLVRDGEKLLEQDRAFRNRVETVRRLWVEAVLGLKA